MHNLVVREQVLLELFLVEDLAVGRLSHQELDNNQELLGMDTEANGTNLRALSQRLDQSSLSLRVLELDSLYAALVVKIACILVVRDTLRERCFHDEVSSLLVEVLLQVGANDDVHGRGLSNLVLMQTAVLVCFED